MLAGGVLQLVGSFFLSSELDLCIIVPFSLPVLSWLWLDGWWAVCEGFGGTSVLTYFCFFVLSFSITIKVFGGESSNSLDNFEKKL